MQVGYIYKIINIVNGKLYIGQTQRDYKRRWYEHRSDLRSNVHPNKPLQNAWNKYKEESFSFSLLETCVLDDIDVSEKRWYEHYSRILGVRNVYNTRNIDKSSFGKRKVFTQTHIDNMRKSRKPMSTKDKMRISLLKKGKRNLKKCKEYTLVSPDGVIYDVSDLISFCADFNLRRTEIYEMNRNPNRLTHRGWSVIRRLQ